MKLVGGIVLVAASLALPACAPKPEGTAATGSAQAGGAPANGGTAAASDPCLEKIKDLLKLQSGADVEVEASVNVSGFRRIYARILTGSKPLQELFVSNDCAYITDKMMDLENYRQQVLKDKAFAECLSGKQIHVFGIPQDPGTTQQLAELGQFSSSLFASCAGDALEQCHKMGITQFPTTVVNGRGYAGVLGRAFVESLTGCGGEPGAAASAPPAQPPAPQFAPPPQEQQPQPPTAPSAELGPAMPPPTDLGPATAPSAALGPATAPSLAPAPTTGPATAPQAAAPGQLLPAEPAPPPSAPEPVRRHPAPAAPPDQPPAPPAMTGGTP